MHPILTIDSGGHKGKIVNMLVTNDGRYLVSASSDKTIRVWDVKTKKEVRKILGQIGDDWGKVNAIALSPDNKWLAVGGNLGPGLISSGVIRIYNFSSGKLAKTLRSHENVVLGLSFSKDGNYLISGSGDRTVKVWNAELGFRLEKTLTGHTKAIYSVGVLSDGRIISIGLDGKIIIWKNSTIDKKFQYDGILTHMSISASKIAVSSDAGNQVLIFDHDLSLIKTIKNEQPKALSFSPDGRYLLVGSSGSKGMFHLYDSHNNYLGNGDFDYMKFHKPDNPYRLPSESKKEYQIRIIGAEYDYFKDVLGTVSSIVFLDNKTAVSSSGGERVILFWNINRYKAESIIRGDGKNPISISLDKNSVSWDYKLNNLFKESKESKESKDPEWLEESKLLEHSFNLDSFTKKRALKKPSILPVQQDGWSLSTRIGGEYGIEKSILVISKHGNEVATVTRGAHDGYKHNSYGFTEDGIIVSGGSGGHLIGELMNFTGHTDLVWSLDDHDGILATASNDQTIKLWSMDNIKDFKLEIDYDKLFVQQELTRRKFGKKWSFKKLIDHADSIGEYGFFLKTPETLPIATLFVGKDNEWAMWTEEGFFDSSPNGDKYVGWHVNRGDDHAAEFYYANQFRRYLYRPDIVKNTLKMRSSKLAIVQAGMSGVTVKDLIERAPADVQITRIRPIGDHQAEVSVKIGSNNVNIPERITIFVNGAQQLLKKDRSLKGVESGDTLTYTVNTYDKNNNIKVLVENKWAENSDVLSYTNFAWNKTKPSMGILYVSAIGINNYPNLTYDQQLNSPGLDAERIINQFGQLKGKLYDKVVFQLLTNEGSNEVLKNTQRALKIVRRDKDGSEKIIREKSAVSQQITSTMISQLLSKQAEKVTANDTSIIFLAGHGVTDSKGDYHFVTADTELDGVVGQNINLKQGTSFDWEKLHNALDETLGKRIVIVDTCQAGSVLSDSKTDIKKLVKEVHNVNAIIYSGTSRQQLGLETEQGGVFTNAILSGIRGEAMYKDNILYFDSLKEYVDKKTPLSNLAITQRALKIVRKKNSQLDVKLMDKSQTPVAVVPDGMEEFVIYQQ